MPNFNMWLGDGATTIDTTARAVDAWQRIQRKPISLSFRTAAGVTLPPQTVRLESDNNASLAESAAGAAPRRKVVVYGVVGHPKSDVPDCDIREGFRFNLGNDAYRVTDIIPETYGEVQAVAESTG